MCRISKKQIIFISLLLLFAFQQTLEHKVTNKTFSELEEAIADGPSSNTTSTKSMVTYCETPNSEKSYCMPLNKCIILKNDINNTNAKAFIEKSRCGPKSEDEDNFSVCCGRYPNYKNKVCGIQKVIIGGRILGGNEAQLGEFPWMARLYHKNQYGVKTFGCGGVLISSKFVLTAAHCLNSDNPNTLGPIFEVHLGEHDTRTDIDCSANNKTCAYKLQIIRVKDLITHPSFNRNQDLHDIGLVYLKKGAKITNFVSPICISDSTLVKPSGFWISGWGSTEVEAISSIKMKVFVPRFNHSECVNKFKLLGKKIIKEQICAGGESKKDSCSGDSGGPLMYANSKNVWIAAGLVSYGFSCGKKGWPAVYTNVSSYQGWIKETMKKYDKKNKTKKGN